MIPQSNDIVPVRDQILEIDTGNSSIVSMTLLLEDAVDVRSRIYNNK